MYQMNEKGPRYLGEYYRVQFFGAIFKEELNPRGYVYKEPGLTKLAEVSQRLEQTFKSRSGIACLVWFGLFCFGLVCFGLRNCALSPQPRMRFHCCGAGPRDRYGPDVIEMIQDSKQVDRTKLDQNKGYIQVCLCQCLCHFCST